MAVSAKARRTEDKKKKTTTTKSKPAPSASMAVAGSSLQRQRQPSVVPIAAKRGRKRLEKASGGGASTASAKSKKKKTPVIPAADVVDEFLKEVGLSADLAEVLKQVGIIDEARIKALGKLSDAVMDRLESSLAEAGLDVAARLLVREGLKQRAAALAE